MASASPSSEPHQERRSIDRAVSDFSLEGRAHIIAVNRFKGKMPEKFDDEKFDDEALKEAVRGVLGKVKLNQVQNFLDAKQQERLSGFVDREYGEARADLQESGLYNFDNPPPQGPRNKPAPTLEEAKSQLLAKLTPEQIEVVKNMQRPVFQLIPKRKKAAYIEALNKKKLMSKDANLTPWVHKIWNDRDVQDGFTNDGFTNPDEKDEIVGWQVGFVEGEITYKATLNSDGGILFTITAPNRSTQFPLKPLTDDLDAQIPGKWATATGSGYATKVRENADGTYRVDSEPMGKQAVLQEDFKRLHEIAKRSGAAAIQVVFRQE